MQWCKCVQLVGARCLMWVSCHQPWFLELSWGNGKQSTCWPIAPSPTKPSHGVEPDPCQNERKTSDQGIWRTDLFCDLMIVNSTHSHFLRGTPVCDEYGDLKSLLRIKEQHNVSPVIACMHVRCINPRIIIELNKKKYQQKNSEKSIKNVIPERQVTSPTKSHYFQ